MDAGCHPYHIPGLPRHNRSFITLPATPPAAHPPGPGHTLVIKGMRQLMAHHHTNPTKIQ